MRTFVAIDITEETRAALEKAQRSMSGLPGIRWARPANIHLTLKFLGEVADAVIPQVFEVMREAVADVEPFEFSVRGLGFFPQRRRPRVIWAGVDSGEQPLGLIAERLNAGLGDIGVPPERRAFRPHLTLGRVRGRIERDAVTAAFRDVGGDDFGVCRAGELVLYMSELRPEGARYTRLGGVGFQGGSTEEN